MSTVVLLIFPVFFLSIFVFVRRYDTEGFYVFDCPPNPSPTDSPPGFLLVNDNPDADSYFFFRPEKQRTCVSEHFGGNDSQLWVFTGGPAGGFGCRFFSASGLHQQSHAHGGSTFCGAVRSRNICVDVTPVIGARTGAGGGEKEKENGGRVLRLIM